MYLRQNFRAILKTVVSSLSPLWEKLGKEIRYSVRREKVLRRRATPPIERIEAVKASKKKIYKKRQRRIVFRYALFGSIFFIFSSLTLSAFLWEWISPLLALLYILQFVGSLALMAIIWTASFGALPTFFFLVTGDGLRATSTKYRNSIYLITLIFFLLDQRDLLDELAPLVPLEALRTNEDLHALILLVLTYFWVNYIIARLYDAVELSQNGKSFEFDYFAVNSLSNIIVSIISFVFNTAFPILLTLAVGQRLNVDIEQDLATFFYHIFSNISAVNVPIIDDQIHWLSSYIYERFIGLGP